MDTAPTLLAHAMGQPEPGGNHRCYYCGARCDGSRPAQVRDTFNDRAIVACPRSDVRCAGCDWAMTNGVPMVGRDKPQKPWTYSYIITATSWRPLTKANISELRSACLTPPPPPYAIALASSGQKHMLFRTPVVTDITVAAVSLEGETIAYRPAELAARLRVASRTAAAAGKPSLVEPLSTSACIAIFDRFEDGEDLIGQWSRVWAEPLSRLAAFLCPPKEECQHEHPANRVVAGRRDEEHVEHGLFQA